MLKKTVGFSYRIVGIATTPIVQALKFVPGLDRISLVISAKKDYAEIFSLFFSQLLS